MVLTLKKRFIYYKKFEIDIWGISKSNLSINPVMYLDFNKKSKNEFYSFLYKKGILNTCNKRFQLFIVSKKISKICGFFWYLADLKRVKSEAQFGRYIYRLDALPGFENFRGKKARVLAMHVVRLFYFIYNIRQFKRLGDDAFKKSGSFEKNYICLLEGRLCCVVYRAGFFSTLFESLQFVKQGHVWVDGRYRSSVYFYIFPMQMLGFNPIIKGTIFWGLLRRLNSGLFLSNCPKYMYISYTFLFFFWKRVPKGRELINPVSIDMLRLCNHISNNV